MATYYIHVFSIFCDFISLILFGMLINNSVIYNKLTTLRPLMKLNLALLFISIVVDLPYFIYILITYNLPEISAIMLYWTGMLRSLMLILIPITVMLLVLDRIFSMLYPFNSEINACLWNFGIFSIIFMVIFQVIFSHFTQFPDSAMTGTKIVL